MKKLLAALLFSAPLFPFSIGMGMEIAVGGGASSGGMQIKKAGAVQEQQQEKMEAVSGSDLVGTAIGLFSGIKALKQQTEALTEQCAPSTADITFVNDMVREYARIGAETSGDMWRQLPAKELKTYCTFESNANKGDGAEICYDYFKPDDEANKNRVWANYPMATVKKLCPPDKPNCAEKEKKYYSNIYEIYGEMNWSDEDMLGNEASNHAKLMQKAEECSPASLKRKKQEMTGNLITQTMGAIGAKQGTGNIMSQVGGLMQTTGGGNSGLLNGVSQMGMGMLPGLLGGGK